MLFSSVGLWEGFLGVKITRIRYHFDVMGMKGAVVAKETYAVFCLYLAGTGETCCWVTVMKLAPGDKHHSGLNFALGGVTALRH